MINRQLSRLLLCSILGSTTLISGCALVRKDSAYLLNTCSLLSDR